MTTDYARDILDRLSHNIRSGQKDIASHVRTRAPATYIDPDRYTEELDALFRHQPLAVGHASQVRNPGDFFTLSILGMPVLVARDRAGGLNAFVNACIHRAARVETAPCGQRQDFICPYHGWSFALDGRLTHVTDRTSFEGIDLDNARLVPLPVVEKHGLIFVQLSPGATTTPVVDLGDMGRQFDAFGLADHQVYRTTTVELPFNWKIAIDGSLETYHLNYLHRRAAQLFTGMATIFDDYGPHTRFVTARRSLAKAEIDEPTLAGVRENAMLTYHIFPTSYVTAPQDHMFLQYYLPTGIDSCTMFYALLVPPGDDPAKAEHWEKTWAMGQSVIGEDYDTMGDIQRAYKAGVSSPAIIGKFEHAIARFHDLCDAAIAAS